MKIVFATDVYFPLIGGIEIVTKRLAEHLSKKGNEVFIIGPSPDSRDIFLRDGNVKVYGLASLPVPLYSVRYIPYVSVRGKIFRILKKVKPDIIHVQTNFTIAKSAALYAKEFKVPIVATGHITNDEIAFGFRNFKVLADLAGEIMAGLYMDVWKYANVITSPSEATAKYFAKNVHTNKKIIPLSNGIDLKRFSNKGFVKSPRPMILFVGRLDPIKKVETIIRAMSEILKTLEVDLILVGQGSEEKYLRGLVERLGLKKNVEFAGFVTEAEVINFQKRASIFIISSVIETQGLAVLEAAAAGLPIVASNVGALPELVKNGKNGYLFPSGNSTELAKKVVMILEKPAELTRMGKESLKIAGEHDMEKVVTQLIGLYQGVIKDNI